MKYMIRKIVCFIVINVAMEFTQAIRLTDGPSALEGRLEAELFGQLWTICGLGFDRLAANVTCTSLGFSGATHFSLKTTYGAGNTSVYSRRISCDGQELTLENCSHSDTDIKECGVNDIVSVACKGGPVKLERFNENIPYEGLLTVYHGGQWYDVLGSVLGPLSNTTARTLCSILGFGSVGFSTLSRDGKDVKHYKSDISCYGNETFIEECTGNYYYCETQGKITCFTRSQMMGLIALFCSDYEIHRVALVNSVIELTIHNETWSVCEDYFTVNAASSVCKILGYTGYTSKWSSPVQDNDSTIIGGLICESGAATLSECTLKHQYSYRPYNQACSNKISITCNNECRQGYFGSNCTKCQCKSVNSLSCHNVTGACTCKQGWSGTTCSDDVNECDAATKACKDPSICINTAGAYFCQCPVGMYIKDTADGGTCEVCSNNTYGIYCMSTCSCNTMNTYISDQMCEPKTGQCFCKPEWGGLSCTIDVNECVVSANVVCQQPYTECINKEGGYTCDCIAGFKNENETCVPIPSAENSNWTTIVIASAVGGSVGIIVIVAVVVCCVRRHREKPDGKPKASREKQSNSRSGEVYTDGTHNVIVFSDSGDYSVLDEAKRNDSSYPRRQNEDVASHKHTDPSRSHNNPYDIIENVNMRNLKSEDMASDGYLTPQPDEYLTPQNGTNDDKYVSDGYLKPMMQKPIMSGDYLKPERTNYQTHEYLKIKHCQEDHASDGNTNTGRNSNRSKVRSKNGD